MTRNKSSVLLMTLIALAAIFVAGFIILQIPHIWHVTSLHVNPNWAWPVVIGGGLIGAVCVLAGAEEESAIAVLVGLGLIACAITSACWGFHADYMQNEDLSLSAIHQLADEHDGKITFKLNHHGGRSDIKFHVKNAFGRSYDVHNDIRTNGDIVATFEQKILRKYYHGDDLKSMQKNKNVCTDAMDGKLCVERHGSEYRGSYEIPQK